VFVASQPPKKKKKKDKVALNGGEAIATPIQFDPKLLGANPESRVEATLKPSLPAGKYTAQGTEKLPPPPSKAVAAAGGGAICHLCQRKFKSAEMLAQHEAKSELHKANLKKAQEAMGKA